MARESIIPIRLTAEGADKVRGELNKATKGLNAVDAAVNDTTSRLKGFAAQLGPVGAGLSKLGVAGLAAVGITAVAGGLLALTKRAAESADALVKQADAVGLSFESLQEYQYAAGLAGIKQDEFNSAIGGFAKRVGELQAGTGTLFTILNKTDKAFSNQLKSTTDTEQALDLYLKKIAETESVTDRAALSAAAFGRTAGIKMALLVKDGTASLDEMLQRAHDLGIVLDEDVARNAERMNDRLEEASLIISRNMDKALLELAPNIERVAIGFSNAAVSVARFFNSFADNENKSEDNLQRRLENVLVRIDALQASIERPLNPKGAQNTRDQLADAIKEADEIRKIMQQRRADEEAITEEKKAQTEAVKQERDEQEKSRKAEEAAKKAAADRVAAEKKYAADHERAIDEIVKKEKEAAQAGLSGVELLAVRRDQELEDYKQRIEGMKDAEELLAKYKLALDEKYQKDKAELESKSAEKSAKQQTQIADKNAQEYQRIFEHAAEGIQDSFTDAFRTALDGGVTDFGDFKDTILGIFKQMIAEMATLAIARPIIVPIVQSLGGAAGAGSTGAALAGQFGGTGAAGGSIPGLAALSAYSPLLLAGGAGALIGGGIGGGTLPSYALGAGGALAGGFGGILLGSGSSAIGAALGSFAPVIGTIAGAVVGGALGGLFGGGDNKPDRTKLRFTIDPTNRSTALFDENQGYGKQAQQAAQQAALTTVDTVSSALSRIGIGLTGDQFELKTRSGKIKLSQSGLDFASVGKSGDRTSVPTDQEFAQAFALLGTELVRQSAIEAGGAVATAAKNSVSDTVEEMLADIQFAKGLISGTLFEPEEINQAEQAIRDLNDAISDAAVKARQLGLEFDREATYSSEFARLVSDFNMSVQDQIQGITAPLLSALDAAEQVAQERLDNARVLGADLVEVERLNALERQRIIDQTFSGVKALADSLSLSQYSPLTPSGRLSAAQSLFDITSTAAQSGNTNAIQTLPQVAQQLLAEGQAFYAGTQGFRDIFTQVNSTLNSLLQFGNQDPVVSSVDKLGLQSVQNTTQLADLLRQLIAAYESNSAQTQDLQDKVIRLLSAA